MHRTFRFGLIITLLLSGSLPAQADQNDPRLDDLFAELQTASDDAQLQQIENSIWAIWMQHDNEAVQRLMQLGTERMNQRQYSEALLVFSQLVESFPDFAEAWNKRATLYYLMGDLERSLADIAHTLALEPRHFGALSGQGLIFVERQELQAAKESFEQLLEVHPHSPAARANLERVLADIRRNVI